jgi:hypothetical protein
VVDSQIGAWRRLTAMILITISVAALLAVVFWLACWEPTRRNALTAAQRAEEDADTLEEMSIW